VIAQKAQDTPQERVRVLQRKLYRAAKDAPQRTFGVLYDKIHRSEGGFVCLYKARELPATETQTTWKGISRVPTVLLQESGTVPSPRKDCATPNAVGECGRKAG
jgi:hypothetical protein